MARGMLFVSITADKGRLFMATSGSSVSPYACEPLRKFHAGKSWAFYTSKKPGVTKYLSYFISNNPSVVLRTRYHW